MWFGFLLLLVLFVPYFNLICIIFDKLRLITVYI